MSLEVLYHTNFQIKKINTKNFMSENIKILKHFKKMKKIEIKNNLFSK
jgi:hypothetical protein